MAISAVGGKTGTSSTGVTSLVLTYSPTSGNSLILAVQLASSLAGLILQDNLSNSYTLDVSWSPNGTVQFACFHINSVPSGVTSFTFSWTSSQAAAAILEEYSGAPYGIGLYATIQVGSPSSASAKIGASGDFYVAVATNGPSSLTFSAGTLRQQTGSVTGVGDIAIADITSGTANTTLTITESGANSWIQWAQYLVGATGSARVSQDIELLANQPSTAKARASQDIELIPNQPSTALARVSQDVELLANQPSTSKARVSQDVILVIGTGLSIGLIQPVVFVVT